MKSISLKPFFFLFIVSLQWVSCVPKKKMVYIQKSEFSQDSVFVYQRPEYHLQINDIIDVKVISLEEEVNKRFNTNSSNGNNVNNVAQTANFGDLYYVTGYSIDDSGYVHLPIVGQIKVVNLTLGEAQAVIEEALSIYFTKFFLQVKLGGVRFSAIGEFNRPGKYTILQNQATIFEAIALAGDLNMVASRSDVKIIRQYPGGTKVHTVNLLDRELINTPFYFIQPNDVIYVEPLKAKSWGVGVNAAQTTTLILSIISSTIVIVASFASFK